MAGITLSHRKTLSKHVHIISFHCDLVICYLEFYLYLDMFLDKYYQKIN